MIFPKSADQPTIEIVSNTISYGHSFIKSKLDNRHLGQMIIDFIKNILGLNQVKDISPEQVKGFFKPKETEEEKQLSTSSNSKPPSSY